MGLRLRDFHRIVTKKTPPKSRAGNLKQSSTASFVYVCTRKIVTRPVISPTTKCTPSGDQEALTILVSP
jgi:hypothetical protein